MKTMKITPTTVVSCDRCDATSVAAAALDWNTVISKGVIAGFLCPDCQTIEENTEAEINAATINYSTDAFGRVIGKAKAMTS